MYVYVEPGTAGGQESPVGEELNFTQLKCIVDLRRSDRAPRMADSTGGDASQTADERTRDTIKERFLLRSGYGAGTLAT